MVLRVYDFFSFLCLYFLLICFGCSVMLTYQCDVGQPKSRHFKENIFCQLRRKMRPDHSYQHTLICQQFPPGRNQPHKDLFTQRIINKCSIDIRFTNNHGQVL